MRHDKQDKKIYLAHHAALAIMLILSFCLFEPSFITPLCIALQLSKSEHSIFSQYFLCKKCICPIQFFAFKGSKQMATTAVTTSSEYSYQQCYTTCGLSLKGP